MSENGSSNSRRGLGFFSCLTLLFITLKLTGFIDWGWWWVLAPTWGWWALVGGIGVLILVGYALDKFYQAIREGFVQEWRSRK